MILLTLIQMPFFSLENAKMCFNWISTSMKLHLKRSCARESEFVDLQLHLNRFGCCIYLIRFFLLLILTHSRQ